MTNNDPNYITMKVQVLIEDGCYHTSTRKVSRTVLALANSKPESILMREVEFGAITCFLRAYKEAMEKSGLKPKEEVQDYIENEFSKSFPGFQANILILNDKIVIYGIRHSDWFIDGVGENPKYPEIEEQLGFTQYTHTYDYIGDGQFTYLRQGHTYYPCTAIPVKTPFTYDQVNDFVNKMNSEGYKLELSKVQIGMQEEYDYMLNRRENDEE